MEISYHECDREACMLTSFLHNCYFSWTLLMLLFLGVSKDLCKIYCWELFRFYFFVDYKKQWRLKKSTSRTGRADSRDPMAWTINTITFITSFSWLYCSISSSIWAQSSKPQSPLSGTQLKDVILGYSDAVLVLAVSSSNIILKRSF